MKFCQNPVKNKKINCQNVKLKRKIVRSDLKIKCQAVLAGMLERRLIEGLYRCTKHR